MRMPSERKKESDTEITTVEKFGMRGRERERKRQRIKNKFSFGIQTDVSLSLSLMSFASKRRPSTLQTTRTHKEIASARERAKKKNEQICWFIGPNCVTNYV